MRVAVFWLAVLSCVLGQAMILRSAMRARARVAAAGLSVPPRASEVAWTLLPALVLAATLVATWRAMTGAAALPR